MFFQVEKQFCDDESCTSIATDSRVGQFTVRVDGVCVSVTQMRCVSPATDDLRRRQERGSLFVFLSFKQLDGKREERVDRERQ